MSGVGGVQTCEISTSPTSVMPVQETEGSLGTAGPSQTGGPVQDTITEIYCTSDRRYEYSRLLFKSINSLLRMLMIEFSLYGFCIF